MKSIYIYLVWYRHPSNGSQWCLGEACYTKREAEFSCGILRRREPCKTKIVKQVAEVPA